MIAQMYWPAVVAWTREELKQCFEKFDAIDFTEQDAAVLGVSDELKKLEEARPEMACPYRVVRFQSWCIAGLGATAGVAGEAAPDGEAGHWMASGAGGRYPSDECGRLVL